MKSARTGDEWLTFVRSTDTPETGYDAITEVFVAMAIDGLLQGIQQNNRELADASMRALKACVENRSPEQIARLERALGLDSQ